MAKGQSTELRSPAAAASGGILTRLRTFISDSQGIGLANAMRKLGFRMRSLPKRPNSGQGGGKQFY